MSAQVHAPYHFVPLSQWVYVPEWAHLVSHDHPFKDGLSGTIELSLKNKTPLLVGAESSKVNDRTPTLVKWARTPEGRLVIPGSSLKGMLRSFLEVATFAKFKQVDDKRYAHRDISSSDTEYSELLKKTTEQAAWLNYDDEKKRWFYKKCKHTRLYNKDLNAFLRAQGIDKTINNIDDRPENKSVVARYEAYPLTKPGISFELGEYFTENDKPRECAVRLGQPNQLSGHPVFVNLRPGRREDLDFNYLFYDVDEKVYELDTTLVNQMFRAHDEELVNYLKASQHPELGIPIFIRIDREKLKNKNADPIVALGLAKMPRMLYDCSVGDLVDKHQRKLNQNHVAFDFCELLFGTLRDYGIGLKSRVGFSDLLCQSDAQPGKSSPVILGEPKASYLNAYIEQPHHEGLVQGELNQYKADAKVSGWKRYPTQATFAPSLPEDLADKLNVQSQLELLESSEVFKGKLIFHNLKPEELGALLWAINPDSSFYHGLGHGKSLGAGAVQLEAKLDIRHGEQVDMKTLVQRFIAHMNEQYPAPVGSNTNWQSSTQIMHLLAFGNMQDNQSKAALLKYMPLQKGRGSMTYADSKKSDNRQALPNWEHQGEKLEREEKLERAALNYAPQGRLHELMSQLLEGNEELISTTEDAIKRQKAAQEQAELTRQKEEQQAALEAEKANASPLFAVFLDQRSFYETNAGKSNELTSLHGDTIRLLKAAAETDSGLSKDELSEIIAFFSEKEPSIYLDEKKAGISKKKRQERQKSLDALKALL